MRMAATYNGEPDWIDPYCEPSSNGKLGHPLRDTKVKAQTKDPDSHTVGEEEAYVREVKERFGTVETSSPGDVEREATIRQVAVEGARVTLNDIPDGNPPAPRIPPYLADVGLTILYGPGDVGKGMTATHWIKRSIDEREDRIAILDYENHPREWRRRAIAMGLDFNDRNHVIYLSPYNEEFWPFKKTGSLVRMAETLHEYFDTFPVDYIVIDSYARATDAAEAMGGQKDAAEFSLGFTILNLPGLLLAHTADGVKWPAKPYGSVHLHNFARETWAIERPDGAEPRDRGFMVELRPRRGAEREQVLGSQFLQYTFSKEEADDVIPTISVGSNQPPHKTVWDMIRIVLSRTTEAIPTAKIRSVIKADLAAEVSTATLTRALDRAAEDDKVIRVTGTPLKWSIKVNERTSE